MDIDTLLTQARSIWGTDKLELEQMLIRMNVVIGDMSRIARAKQESGEVNDTELQKEMGNIIFSMIRWCDDMGYDPKECIRLARDTQALYAQKLLKSD